MSGQGKAVVLLSGGIDSTTTLAVALDAGYEAYALTVDYGQGHAVEVEAAGRVASSLGVSGHVVLRLDLRGIARSSLTGPEEVPRGRSDAEISAGIPSTYVPARNTILLSLALAWAETIGARDVFVGVSAVDYPGYPDCRSEFIDSFEELAAVATRCGVEGDPVRVRAPFVSMSKAEVIRLGLRLGVDYSLTHSCYDPVGGLACGLCDSCVLRRRGFSEAGVRDPAAYRA